MAKSRLVRANEVIAETVTKGYKKVEDAVIGVTGIVVLLMLIPLAKGIK